MSQKDFSGIGRLALETLLHEALQELKDSKKAGRLLEDLTPGGSEFSSNPEACAQFVRDRLETNGRLATRANAVEARVKLLAELRRRALNKCQSWRDIGREVMPIEEVESALSETEADAELPACEECKRLAHQNLGLLLMLIEVHGDVSAESLRATADSKALEDLANAPDSERDRP